MVHSHARLTGRTALVTGATSGIGRSIAEAFAAEGAFVAVSGRNAERGAAVVEAISAAGGRAAFVAADLGAGAEAAHALAASATAVLGGHVDILVNNAGIYPATATATLDEKTFEEVMAINVGAPMFLVQALAPAMAERGGGAIVNLGSWIAQVGVASGGLYAASKAAIEQLTRGWAADYGSAGIRVNAVSPGVTLTDGTSAAAEHLDAMVAPFPAGRTARPEEIAAAVVYLASDEASYLHGTVLVADGGALATR